MSSRPKSVARAAGFSLVEVMVGLVIGMLAMIVMLQVFSLTESQRRTATSGGDANSNGAIMLYQVQHDIDQAGYGMIGGTNGNDMFNCGVIWKPSNEGSALTTAVPFAPVTINSSLIPAGDASTDTLLIIYGNGNSQPEGNIINGLVGNVYTMQMAASFNVGDRVVAVPATCGTTNMLMDTITAAPTPQPVPASLVVTVATGVSTANNWTLFNLGQAPVIVAYAIRGGNLTMCDYMAYDCSNASYVSNAKVWVPIASNIVSMRAEYDRDTTVNTSAPYMDGVPDIFDQTTPQTTDTIAPNCGWVRISAIRLALVARSSQYEKGVVTTTANNAGMPDNTPVWDGTAVTGAMTTGLPIVMGTDSAIAPDQPWKHYRYKVFQTLVPIRNITWLGVPTGC